MVVCVCVCVSPLPTYYLRCLADTGSMVPWLPRYAFGTVSGNRPLACALEAFVW